MSKPRDLLIQPRLNHRYLLADHLNPEGFPAFTHSLEKQYLQMLLTNTLGGTFYASQRELVAQAYALHLEMSTSQPQIATRHIVFARQEGLMRLQPIVGLAFLSAVDRNLFRDIFDQVIYTPRDLEDFVVLLKGDGIPAGLTRSVKRVINHWLNRISEYHALKYANSLKYVMRLTHPVPETPYQKAIFAWLHNRKQWRAMADRDLTPQITAFERLKDAVDNRDRRAVLELINQGKLPYELVTGVTRPTKIQWYTMSRQMPYMALLRHLKTLHRNNVLLIQKKYIAERLGDVDAMRKAKVLPFRLLKAYQEVGLPINEKTIRGALETALEESCGNFPSLGQRVCISPDVSGSMGGRISDKGTTRYIDIAGIFGASLLKLSDDAIFLPFNHAIVTAELNRQDGILKNTRKITHLLSGGTEISAPIRHLLEKEIVIDTFIGITDNIEWTTVFGWGRQDEDRIPKGFLYYWEMYKQQVAPQAKAFLITIAPYRSHPTSHHTPDVHYIYGWSEQVLQYISLMTRHV